MVILWLVNGVIAGLGGLFARANGSGGSAVVFAQQVRLTICDHGGRDSGAKHDRMYYVA